MALLLIVGPSLLPAFALEHADGAATEGIQHCPEESGFLSARIARSDWVWVIAGKDFVLELVNAHDAPL